MMHGQKNNIFWIYSVGAVTIHLTKPPWKQT